MKAIQLLMDADALVELDQVAQRQGTDRSKLIRAAVARFLAESRRQTREDAHRRAYEQHPLQTVELTEWEAIQTWPED
jgi:metal-responsive CopG/Arc/MetJ family transcriptional regulator